MPPAQLLTTQQLAFNFIHELNVWMSWRKGAFRQREGGCGQLSTKIYVKAAEIPLLSCPYISTYLRTQPIPNR